MVQAESLKLMLACGGTSAGVGDGIGRRPETRSALTIFEQLVLIQHW